MSSPTPQQPIPPATPGVQASPQPSTPTKMFSVRDFVIFASIIVVFIGSTLPIVGPPRAVGNFWSSAGLFFLGIGIVLPLAVGLLFLARRLNQWEPRIGSLTLDQFASVIATLCFAYFFISVVTDPRGVFLLSCLGAAGFLIATVFAHWIPLFQATSANSQSAPHPPAGSQWPSTPQANTAGAGLSSEASQAGAAERGPRDPAPEQRAFWFAVERSRAVIDENSGTVLYTIEPGVWFLALQDRGSSFLVQAPDGTIGVLLGTEGIERAPES